MGKVRVAIVGLGFGAEFIEIFQAHPDAEMYAICQRNPESLKRVGDQFGVAKRYSSFDELLRDPNVDAVHINSPIADHAPMSLKALQAGEHGAFAVPVAASGGGWKAVVDARSKSGKSCNRIETGGDRRRNFFAKE